MYIKNFIKEIKTWKIVKKTIKENIEKINSLGFDLDWVGRIYTVIDIPDEINNLPQKSIKETIERNAAIDLYIKQQLVPLSELLNELRLSELIMYPDHYEQFEGTNSILVVISPDRRYTSAWRFLGMLLAMCLFVSGIVIALKFIF